ncbi:MAG: type III PLP-dependent enzyme [Gammaproteobacteria bacterium]|nr:type III PLP-dependent enzyme [Gammaproteobacteria bacterium]
MKHEKVCDLNSTAATASVPWIDTKHLLAHQTPDLPMFLYAASSLIQTSRSLQLAFPGEVSYAVKANPKKAILETLWRSGIGSFDVASINEIKLVRSLFPDARLHFNNPVKSDVDIERACCAYGVRSFVVDDFVGLNSLIPYLSPDTEITVRFKLEHDRAAYDFGSKFGATPDQAIPLLMLAKKHGARCSLTFHPGSQCSEPAVYKRYIQESAVIAKQARISLEQLNVGGGFPVSYENYAVLAVREFFKTIYQTVAQCFPDNAPKLLCEPGRALVAPCTSLLTRVLHVRESGEVFINDGVYGGLQEQSIMPIQTPIRLWRNGVQLEQDGEPVTVFGPTCDPVDKLLSTYRLCADIKVGDYVEFGLMGAYGSATTTGFNGFEPAEYVSVERGLDRLE